MVKGILQPRKGPALFTSRRVPFLKLQAGSHTMDPRPLTCRDMPESHEAPRVLQDPARLHETSQRCTDIARSIEGSRDQRALGGGKDVRRECKQDLFRKSEATA